MSDPYTIFEEFREKKWDNIINVLEGILTTSDDENEDDIIVSVLPKADFITYGSYPKLQAQTLLVCEKCGKLVKPNELWRHHEFSHLVHKSSSGESNQTRSNHSSSSLLKKKSNSSKTKKKSSSTLPVPLPPLFTKTVSPPPVLSQTKEMDLPPPVLQPVQVGEVPDEQATGVKPVTPPTAITNSVPLLDLASAYDPEFKFTIIVTPPTSPVSVIAPAAVPAESAVSLADAVPTRSKENAVLVPATETATAVLSTTKHSHTKMKHKRTRKSRVCKDFNPDKQCGVIEGSRGPCLRSIMCSSHSLPLRRLVPGRSKDLNLLMIDYKAPKEKEAVSSTPTPKSNGSPAVTKSNADSRLQVDNSGSRNSLSKSLQNVLPTLAAAVAPPQTEIIINSSQSSGDIDSAYGSSLSQELQSSATATSLPSVIYMPMSPISVSTFQYVQLGNAVVSYVSTPQPAPSPPLAMQPILIQIPDRSYTNITVYPSHPKPLSMPTVATRKIGGSVLLQGQRLDRHRSEIKSVLHNKRQTINVSNSYKIVSQTNAIHKQSLPKSVVRGNAKINNLKRPAPERLSNDSSKIAKVSPDVNGFILHADVSEAAEAPQSNNSFQEKIALLNMK